MYKINYNETGDILGFYIDSIHKDIPEPTVEVTQEVWQQIISCREGKYQVLSGEVTFVPTTIEEKIIRARQDIKTQRDTLESASPFMYLNKPFDYDAKSRERLGGAVQNAILATMSQQTFTITWTLYDNTTLDLTAQDLLGFPVAEAMRSGSLHEQARDKKARLDLCTSQAEIDAILEEGWN